MPVHGVRSQSCLGCESSKQYPDWGARKGSQGQPLQSVFPLRSFRCEPDDQQFVDCRSNIEALRDEKYTRALLSSAPECAEVSQYRADVGVKRARAAVPPPAPKPRDHSYGVIQPPAPSENR